MEATDQTVPLDYPLKRGETTIEKLTLRKPNSGALRGCSLRALLDMEADAIAKVLPRISEPPLTDAEVARLDPADLLQCGVKVAGFLLPKAAREQAEAEQQQNSQIQ